MRVSFNVNLGSQDAALIGVDFKQCVIGAAVDVEDAAGKWLVSRGIANDISPAPSITPQPIVADETVEQLVADEPTTQQPDNQRKKK